MKKEIFRAEATIMKTKNSGAGESSGATTKSSGATLMKTKSSGANPNLNPKRSPNLILT